MQLSKFAVSPPDIKIFTPSTHEMLNELTVHILPKLCREDLSDIQLEYRSFQVGKNCHQLSHHICIAGVSWRRGVELEDGERRCKNAEGHQDEPNFRL